MRIRKLRIAATTSFRGICLMAAAFIMLGLAGCGGSSGGGPATVTNKAIATGSSGVAVDPLTKLAFVAWTKARGAVRP